MIFFTHIASTWGSTFAYQVRTEDIFFYKRCFFCGFLSFPCRLLLVKRPDPKPYYPNPQPLSFPQQLARVLAKHLRLDFGRQVERVEQFELRYGLAIGQVVGAE